MLLILLFKKYLKKIIWNNWYFKIKEGITLIHYIHSKYIKKSFLISLPFAPLPKDIFHIIGRKLKLTSYIFPIHLAPSASTPEFHSSNKQKIK